MMGSEWLRRNSRRYGAVYAIAVTALIVAFVFTSVACEGTVDRKVALEQAQAFIGDNFPGLSVVEFEGSGINKQDGVWRFVFKCKQLEDGGIPRGNRVTLTLFVNEDDLNVWGSTAEGWTGM